LVVCGLAAVVAATAAFAGTGARVAHGPRLGATTHSTSTNWSGYAVIGSTPFTDVNGSWVEPSVDCSSTTTGGGVPGGGPGHGKQQQPKAQPSYASFWIGLDGYSSNTVEQTGTDSDCNGTTPSYYAWYEFYPAYPVNFSNPVQPNDVMTAEVKDGNGLITLTLSDTTRNWTQTVTHSDHGYKLSSAEWVAEAPSGPGVLPLANFGTVNFSNASATGGGKTGPINAFTYDPMTMVTDSNQTKAAPSGLTNTSTSSSFSVTWAHS
jgi:hypothetical protein